MLSSSQSNGEQRRSAMHGQSSRAWLACSQPTVFAAATFGSDSDYPAIIERSDRVLKCLTIARPSANPAPPGPFDSTSVKAIGLVFGRHKPEHIETFELAEYQWRIKVADMVEDQQTWSRGRNVLQTCDGPFRQEPKKGVNE